MLRPLHGRNMPNPQQIREIAAAAMCELSTVRKVYSTPERAQSSSRERVAKAAKKLGYAAPPAPAREAKP